MPTADELLDAAKPPTADEMLDAVLPKQQPATADGLLDAAIGGITAKGAAYGPVVGETHRDAMIGAYDNPLGPHDVALSPGLQKLFPLGSKVMANGRGPYTVADSSFIRPGQPTSNMIEFRDTAQPPATVSITPAPGSGNAGIPMERPAPEPQVFNPRNEQIGPMPAPKPIARPIIGKSAMRSEFESMQAAKLDPLDAGIPLPFGQQEGTAAQIAAGVANFPVQAANFALSPVGQVASIALPVMAPIIQQLVGAGFTVQQAMQAIQAKNAQERTGAILGAATAGLGTAASLLPRGPLTEVPPAFKQLKGGDNNASSITSTASVSIPEVRQEVGGGTPLRQQGQTATAQNAVSAAPETSASGAQSPVEFYGQSFKTKAEAESRLAEMISVMKSSPAMSNVLQESGLTAEQAYHVLKYKNKWGVARTAAHDAAVKLINEAQIPKGTGAGSVAGGERTGQTSGAGNGPAAPPPSTLPNAPEVAPAAPSLVAQKWTQATEEVRKPLSAPPGEVPPPAPTEMMSGLAMPKFDIRRVTNLDMATGERSMILQRSAQEAKKASKDLIKSVPDRAAREAIAIYIEAGGDPAVLADWAANAKSKWFKKAVARAQKLTPKEIAAAGDVRDAYRIMGNRGQAEGVLESQRDNYITHIWKVNNPFKGFGSRTLKQRFAFSKARTFNTFFEGDQAGFTPRTLDVANLVPAYITEMNRVIADRRFVDSLVGLKGRDGRPLVIPRGRVNLTVDEHGNPTLLSRPNAQNLAVDEHGVPVDQMDYRVMQDQPALRRWGWRAQDSAGQPVFQQGDLALHPEAYKRIHAMIGESAIRKAYREHATEGAFKYPAKFVRALDVTQGALKREMFGLAPPFHQVQEGWHGIGHRVNPFWGLKQLDAADPRVQDAMRHGLMAFSDRTSSYQYVEGLGAHKTLITSAMRKFGKLGARQLADVIEGYQEYVFGSYIPRLKYATYEKIVERNMDVFKNELKAGTVKEADVKMLSAQQANTAYGHLNYALLDRNPTLQHFLQLTLLAPDFLEARGKFVGQAIKGITSPVGREQLKAVAVLAAVQAATMYTLAEVTGGEWDEKHPFEFTLHNRKYTLRSVPEDTMRLFTDTRAFVSGRVNPTAQTAYQIYSGKNWRGEKASLWDTTEEYLAKWIPLMARSLPGVNQLTASSRNSPISPLEQFAGSAGWKVSRYSPITETYKMADAWQREQGVSPDTGTYPVSKYLQMRYALEDGDLDRAGAEYDKLKETLSPTKIRDGFRESVKHPFTGSKDSDRQFAASLKGEDKAMYDLAVDKRKSMLDKFDYLFSGK